MSVNGPVGWFPDPNGGNGLRYFDGRKWTKIAPPPALAPTAPVPATSAAGVVAGGGGQPMIFAACFNGVCCLGKGKSRREAAAKSQSSLSSS